MSELDIQISVEEGAWPSEENLRETSDRVLDVAAKFLRREEKQPFPKTGAPEVSLVFTNDEAIVALSIDPVRIVGICLMMMAVSSVLFRAVTGTGATRYSLLLELITLVVYMVYVVIIIEVLDASLAVAWTSEFVYWLVLAWLCWKYLKSGKWKKYKV